MGGKRASEEGGPGCRLAELHWHLHGHRHRHRPRHRHWQSTGPSYPATLQPPFCLARANKDSTSAHNAQTHTRHTRADLGELNNVEEKARDVVEALCLGQRPQRRALPCVRGQVARSSMHRLQGQVLAHADHRYIRQILQALKVMRCRRRIYIPLLLMGCQLYVICERQRLFQALEACELALRFHRHH